MRRYSSLILVFVLVVTLFGCMHRRSVSVSPAAGSQTASRDASDSPSALSNFIQATLKISGENTAATEEKLTQMLKRRPGLAELAKRAAANAKDLDSRRMLADAYMEEGLPSCAFQMYQEIQSVKPEDPQAEIGVARVWDRWGDYRLAHQHAERAVLLAPGSADALETLGRVHLHRNEVDQALSAFLTSLAIKPQNAPLMTNVGYLYLQRGDLVQARRYLERSIAVDESIAESHNNLGIVLAKLGDRDRALREFMAVNDPAAAFNNLGVVYLGQKRWAEARDAFRRALSLDPAHKKAQGNLAEAEAHMPRPVFVDLPMPRNSVEVSVGERPRSVKKESGTALQASAAGRDSRIAAAYADALQRFRRRQYKQTIDILQWLLAQYPNDKLASNCQYWIGESYFGLADYKSAYSAFKRVTEYGGSLKKNDALVMMKRAAFRQQHAGRTAKG